MSSKLTLWWCNWWCIGKTRRGAKTRWRRDNFVGFKTRIGRGETRLRLLIVDLLLRLIVISCLKGIELLQLHITHLIGQIGLLFLKLKFKKNFRKSIIPEIVCWTVSFFVLFVKCPWPGPLWLRRGARHRFSNVLTRLLQPVAHRQSRQRLLSLNPKSVEFRCPKKCRLRFDVFSDFRK